MIPQRFMDKVSPVPEAGCWLWSAGSDKDGYGKYWNGRATVRAHRASWEMERGGIPPGLQVLHRCDTPSCVNPAHMFLGTNADNMTDKSRKGRVVKSCGEKHGMSKLTDAQADSIRSESGLHREIAERYGVSRSLVTCIKSGRTRPCR